MIEAYIEVRSSQLAAASDTVAVLIDPHAIPYDAPRREDQTAIERGQFLIGVQRHFDMAIFIYVAVRGIVAPLIGGAEIKSLRSHHL